MTRLSSQKRSFSSKASSCTLLNISFLQSVEIWASNLSLFFQTNFFIFDIWPFCIHNVFSPKCGDPSDNSTEALATKVLLEKFFWCFLGKCLIVSWTNFIIILLGQISVTFLGHLFQYFLDKYYLFHGYPYFKDKSLIFLWNFSDSSWT